MKTITSRDNAQYKELKQLAGSSQARRKAGRTLLDGVHLCQSWIQLRGMPEQCIVSESALANPEVADIVGQLEARHAHVIALPDALYNAVSQVEHGVGLMFLIATPERAVPEALSVSAVLLDNVQDPGNVGSILRSAAAAGIGQVYCSAGTAFCCRRRCCARRWAPTSCWILSRTSTWRRWCRARASRRWPPAATPPSACTTSTCASRWRGCSATKGRAWPTICWRWRRTRW